MRSSILALALIASPVFAGDVVSDEFAVAAKVYTPGIGAAAVAVGATKAYAAWSQLGTSVVSYYGAELAANGAPLPDTRTLLGTGNASKVFAAGDVFYIYGDDSDGSFLRRADNSGPTLRPGAVTAFVYNGSRILIVGTRTELYDTSLNRVVPDLSASVSATSWTVAGSKFFGISTTAHLVSIDNDGHVQTLAATLGPELAATIAGNGTELLNVWMLADGLHLYGQRYALDGSVLSDVFDVGPVAGSRIFRFDATAMGSDFIVSWSEGNSGDVPMYFRRVSGSSAAAQVLAGDGITPAVVAGPAGIFMTWSTAGADFFSRMPMIRRVDVAGDAQPLVLGLSSQTGLRVVSDGLVTLAGWVEDGRVRIGRIDANGVPLDGAGIVVAPDVPANQVLDNVLFDGVNYFVLLENFGPDGLLNTAYARLVHRDGTFATAVFPIVPPPARLQMTTAAWTGTVYRVMAPGGKAVIVDVLPSGLAIPPVTTSILTSGSNSYTLLWGARPLFIDRRGAATFLDDQSNIILPVDPSLGGGQWISQAATNGTSILIPWRKYSAYPLSPQVANLWLARWDMKGKAIDIPWLIASLSTPSPNTPLPGGLFALADGAAYKLVIEAGTARLAHLDDHSFACRCIDNATDLPGVSNVSDFAAAGTDRTVVAYMRSVTETGMNPITPATRAFIRFVHPGPPPRHRAAGH